MRRKVDWSMLPEELLRLIALRLYSVLELLRFRSTCTSWRSSVSVADDNPFSNRPVINLNPLVVDLIISSTGKERINGLDRTANLSRATFFRVSSSSQGWLIKCDADDLNNRTVLCLFNCNAADLNYKTFGFLLNPLSRLRLRNSCRSIDLSKFKVSEIQPAYIVQNWRRNKEVFGFKRLVLADNHRLLGVGCDGKIRYWNGKIWTRIKDQMARFCDIIIHRGLTYALDSNGIVWWINSSLSIIRYGPSLDENVTKGCCRDLILVECCGEFYIVDRLLEDNLRKRKYIAVDPWSYEVIHDDAGNTKCELSQRKYYPKTVGFKVYKVDKELEKWIQVKSFGGNAFVMATDTCFSVSAHDFNGCLQNSIYFSDEEEYAFKVFKLDDGSITTMSRNSQSCFQMFGTSFQ